MTWAGQMLTDSLRLALCASFLGKPYPRFGCSLKRGGTACWRGGWRSLSVLRCRQRSLIAAGRGFCRRSLEACRRMQLRGGELATLGATARRGPRLGTGQSMGLAAHCPTPRCNHRPVILTLWWRGRFLGGVGHVILAFLWCHTLLWWDPQP